MMQLSPQVNTAISMLCAAGFEAFLVGGAVRDYAMGADRPKDFDITTNALPGQVGEVFSDYRRIETGRRHGTVTVLLDGESIEITTYRIDGEYSDHRRPDEVYFTRTLREDLERRDFTMNALAYHPAQGILDLVGGLEDLRAGRIRCVGDPDRRFREDALRILRALRFAAVLGMDIEEDTSAALHRSAPLLENIAAERKREELTKLLCGKNAAPVLRAYADVVALVIPALGPMSGFPQHNPHHDRDVWEHSLGVLEAIPPEPILRWAALLHDVGKPACFSLGTDGLGHFYGHAQKSEALAEAILRELRFDTASREQITKLIRYHDLPLSTEKKSLRRLMSKLGPQQVFRLIQLHMADTRGQSPLCQYRLETYAAVRDAAEALLREENCFSLRDLAVNGRDMMALGLRGRQVGQALEACLEAVLDERVANEPAALLAFVRERQDA